MQGIEERCTVYLGPRLPAVGLKSGDLGPASPVKQSPIPRSGSFTEVCTVFSEGWTELGKAPLAGLRWQRDWAAADSLRTGKRRRARLR